MSKKTEIAAQLVKTGRDVFGLEDEERVAGYADEVAEMMQTLSSASIEKTQEPFPPLFDASREEK
ncbi:MAG: hypothetical protein F4X91_16545 [Nitrospinae bacterium]|nr:hypothetical protein [Nitrospinota bacterium]